MEKFSVLPALSIDGLLFLSFIVFFALSAILNPFKESARTQSLLLMNSLSLFYFTVKLAPSSKKVLQIVFCLVSSLFSLFFILSPFFPNLFHPRLVSEFFINQNVAGIFSLLALFVSIICYKEVYGFQLNPNTLSEGGTGLRKFFLFPIILNALSFLWARSFGAWVAAGAAWIYLYSANRKRVGLAAGGITLLLLLYGIFYSSWAAQRLHWWSASFQILLSSPFFGSGPGTFEKLFSFFMDPGLKSPYAHNFFLQTASEWGIPATLLFLLYIVLKIKSTQKNFLTAGLIALLVQNLYDYSMNIPGFFICFWILLGIASKEQKKSASHWKPSVWAVRLPIAALLLFSGWSFGIKPLLSFSETLQAQKAFEKNNLKEAENHLRKAIALDPLPSKTWSDLSKLLRMQYQIAKENPLLLQEAITCQKEALKRDPFSKEFVLGWKDFSDDKKR